MAKQDKEVKEKALDSIMRDLAPVDSILFAMGTEDTKDQERASLSEYLDSRIDSIKLNNHSINYSNRGVHHQQDLINQDIKESNYRVIKELKAIKEKFNL